MPGKVPPDELLEHVFDRTGSVDETVIQGPADGEDAAAIDWPGGDLVVSSDPISLAASQVGTLGVYVACNDIAASGADPRWLTVVVMLPDEGRRSRRSQPTSMPPPRSARRSSAVTRSTSTNSSARSSR